MSQLSISVGAIHQDFVPPRVKPVLRGIPHGVAAVLAVPAVIMLINAAHPGVARLAAGIYGVCLVTLLAVSSIYHAPMWPLTVRAWFRRLDHANIHLLIAGTYTPMCVVALPPRTGTALLMVAWGAAWLGILKAFLWPRAPRWVSVVVYVGLGCLIVPLLPDLRGKLGDATVGLVAWGGALYILGSMVYLRRWPKRHARLFGFHEIFHVFVVAAAACHFVVLWRIVSSSS